LSQHQQETHLAQLSPDPNARTLIQLEYHPAFRITFITHRPAPAFSDAFACNLTLVNFTCEGAELAELILHEVLRRERQQEEVVREQVASHAEMPFSSRGLFGFCGLAQRRARRED
jgi:hypothetical protein